MRVPNQENLARMIQLADQVFGMKQDLTQISVNSNDISKLRKIHPDSLIEKNTKKGPIAWILVFPTTEDLMIQFIKRQIDERDLLKKTPLGVQYDTIYLCSALVLPEYRRKGLAKRLMRKAIKSIQKKHPIKSLFYWAFSIEGKKLAISVAKEVSLPLYRKAHTI